MAVMRDRCTVGASGAGASTPAHHVENRGPLMNYRHAYHAGNFADVLKHVVLLACLAYLQRKDGPLFLLDTHAGAGSYDLGGPEAAKTGEWERGIGRLLGRSDVPEGLSTYLGAVGGDLQAGRYPGSPLLMARALRPQDRMAAAELHGETFADLEAALRPWRNARALCMDGYECARANLPPKERRGLVLVDPPYEESGEADMLARQMREWKKRWATGVTIVWYPIKAQGGAPALHDAARELGLPRTWFVETLVNPRHYARLLNGSGLIVFNTPFTVPEAIDALLPWLKDALGLHETASGWLVPPE